MALPVASGLATCMTREASGIPTSEACRRSFASCLVSARKPAGLRTSIMTGTGTLDRPGIASPNSALGRSGESGRIPPGRGERDTPPHMITRNRASSSRRMTQRLDRVALAEDRHGAAGWQRTGPPNLGVEVQAGGAGRSRRIGTTRSVACWYSAILWIRPRTAFRSTPDTSETSTRSLRTPA